MLQSTFTPRKPNLEPYKPALNSAPTRNRIRDSRIHTARIGSACPVVNDSRREQKLLSKTTPTENFQTPESKDSISAATTISQETSRTSDFRPPSEKDSCSVPCSPSATPRTQTARTTPRIAKLAYSQAKLGGTAAWEHAQASTMKNFPRSSASSRRSKIGELQTPPIPLCWTPTKDPDMSESQQSLSQSFRFSSATGIRIPPASKPRRLKRLSEINSYQVQLLYSGSAEFVPRKQKQDNENLANGVVTQMSPRSSTELWLGRDIKKEDIKEFSTVVVYSSQYYQSTKSSPSTIAAKGRGVVVGIDADGLMTHVKWQNGIVEYCCTGFGNLYFLALADSPDQDNSQLNSTLKIKNWIDVAKNSPLWETDADGLSVFPRHEMTRAKDLNDASWSVRILSSQIKHTMEGTRKYAKLLESLVQAKKDLKTLYEDRERLNEWIHCTIGDVEFKIPPSALAPSAAAAVGVNKTSILEELRRMVRREAEKDRRNFRREAEDAALREMIEKRKSKAKNGITLKKDLEEKLQTLNAREQRKQLDPWTAICTASAQELDEVIQETFSLFDLDSSKSISAVEFEDALKSMSIDAPSDVVELIVAKADKDGNGSLDFEEFKDLTTSMVHAAKYAQEQATKNAIKNEHLKKVFANRTPNGLLTSAVAQYSTASDEVEGDREQNRSFLEHLLDLLTRDDGGVNFQKQERRFRLSKAYSSRTFSISSPDRMSPERPDAKRRVFERRKSMVSPLPED